MTERVLVCGSRDYADREWVFKNLDTLVFPGSTIIEGGQTGADTLAKEWAIDRGFPYEEFAADWRKWGKGAGPLRNQKMLDSGIDKLIAFSFNVGKSKGTKDMVNRARGKVAKIVIFEDEPDDDDGESLGTIVQPELF